MSRMSNERKCCDAVIRVLEEKTGETRRDVWSPEDTPEYEGPQVEIRLRLGSQEYALEHTFVEPFGGEYENSIPLAGLTAVVEDALSAVVPPDARIMVTFPSTRALKVKRAELESHQKQLEGWALNKAPDLYHRAKSERIKRASSHLGRPDGFPYQVRLTCYFTGSESDNADPVTGGSRFLPDDIHSLFDSSMERALREKFPKLSRCKQEGARTVLVLEKCDYLVDASTLRNVICDLHDLFSEKVAFSDEIYYVDTRNNAGTWHVHSILKNGAFCSDSITRSPRKFAKSSLENLMAM